MSIAESYLKTGILKTGILKTGILKTGILKTGILKTRYLKTGTLKTFASPSEIQTEVRPHRIAGRWRSAHAQTARFAIARLAPDCARIDFEKRPTAPM